MSPDSVDPNGKTGSIALGRKQLHDENIYSFDWCYLSRSAQDSTGPTGLNTHSPGLARPPGEPSLGIGSPTLVLTLKALYIWIRSKSAGFPTHDANRSLGRSPHKLGLLNLSIYELERGSIRLESLAKKRVGKSALLTALLSGYPCGAMANPLKVLKKPRQFCDNPASIPRASAMRDVRITALLSTG